MVLIHINDIPIASYSIELVNWFKENFSKVFKIKDLGELLRILRINIIRDRKLGTLKLNQEHYILESL